MDQLFLESCHYGTAASYTMQAANEGMIGFTCSNTYPLMCPFGAKEVRQALV